MARNRVLRDPLPTAVAHLRTVQSRCGSSLGNSSPFQSFPFSFAETPLTAHLSHCPSLFSEIQPWLDPDPKVRAEWKELNKKLFLRVFLKSTLWDIPMMSLMSPSGRFDYDPETIPPWYKTLFILTFAGLLGT